jgi:aspartyl-tRNA synthetase
METAASCDHHCVIEKLLQTPFSSLSYDDKLKIINNDKPNLNLHIKINTCTRYFNTSLYEAIPWLCGCDKLNKSFCWPCPLFSEEIRVLNNAGY